MKKFLLVVAACAIATPVLAQTAPRGGVTNSARVTQTAGAMAFSLIAQGGERALIEAPRTDPYVRVESGAFIMPYINESFNAALGGDVRVYDPIGSYIDVTRVIVNVDGDGPNPGP